LADSKSPRYVLYKNRLHRVPMSPLALLTTSLLGFSGKLRLLCEPFISPRTGPHDETLRAFSTRRLGPQATERMLAPFVSGVWAGNIDELSAQSAFPKLVAWERERGSLFKGMLSHKKAPGVPNGLLSFQGGLRELPEALGRLLGTDLHLNEKIVGLDHNAGSNKWVLSTNHGVYHVDRLVSSLPAHKMAALAKPWAPALSQTLSAIPYVSLTVAHFSVPTRSVGHSLNGFGYLIAPSENAPLLGCLFSSSLFPGRAPDGRTLLTAFIKGLSPDLDAVKQSISRTLAITSPLDTVSTRTYEKAIPQYTLGHRERLAVIHQAEKDWPGLVFIGNYLEGISVGDVVRQSFQKSF
jgi:oxygen-dependent protoporphyrinogen oxidase